MVSRTSILIFITLALCACLYQQANAIRRPIKEAIEGSIQELLGKTSAGQATQEGASDAKWNPFEPYMNRALGAEPAEESLPPVQPNDKKIFFEPIEFVLRIIALVTFPPRFIVRFFFTFIATFLLTLFGCQVIPEVRCSLPVSEMIPGIMDGLREELNFYASLAED